MKTRILQILGVAAIATIGMVSCDTDACKDVECGVNGTCLEGDCVCDAGYEGVKCETEERAQFFGAYSVSESCTSGNYTYNTTIATSATAVTVMLIQNFGDYGANITATVNGNSITIANQTVTVNGYPLTFSGSGQKSGNILTITYTVSDGTDSDTCTMTCTKQ